MMKVELHNSVCICLLFGISLIFYPAVGSFLDGISHSSKVSPDNLFLISVFSCFMFHVSYLFNCMF